MTNSLPEARLLRLPEEVDEGIRSQRYRAARRGELVRLSPGTYVSAAEWSELGVDERYRTMVAAARGRLHPDDVFSHWSAAALWHLPIIGPWPSIVHVTAPVEARRRSTTVLRRHRRELVDAPKVLDGMVATSLAETILDVARVATFSVALAMGDAALRRSERSAKAVRDAGVTRTDLARVFEALDVRRGRARAAGTRGNRSARRPARRIALARHDDGAGCALA